MNFVGYDYKKEHPADDANTGSEDDSDDLDILAEDPLSPA